MGVDKGDQSLLDRLNALKGNNDAGISLDRSSNAINASIGVERAKPPSKEDALAARLRSLRNTPERDVGPQAQSPKPRASSTSQPQSTATTSPLGETTEPNFDTDDQTLDELLSGEDTSGEPPEWARPPPQVQHSDVESLLAELSRGITPSDPPTQPKDGLKPKDPSGEDEEGPDPDEDSDGEQMTQDVHTLLSRALDEAELEGRLNPPPENDTSTPTDANPDKVTLGTKDPPQKPASPDDDSGLGLPSVPTALADADDAGLGLPSVPSTVGRDPEAIEADLAARMAALSAPSAATGGGPDIGLPSVPSETPANRLRTKTGYTDADEEKWCTVCLEDATLRCLGCDDDPYCTRCWREMHVGPAAAFDDRTHKAVLFGRDPKKPEKRVMLGA